MHGTDYANFKPIIPAPYRDIRAESTLMFDAPRFFSFNLLIFYTYFSVYAIGISNAERIGKEDSSNNQNAILFT